ncbi:hypothetical protein LSCM1_04915 [Leishmania martiniquensis]|uniref:FYVE-type domain-containing protein n=1 Tax=Leishmania martiniquensis TaxID=1580590 RepID=A0A836KRX2_9TRYP|nr:hypothetical protein LSCM1_04915 [Leishmania martiniquensis]
MHSGAIERDTSPLYPSRVQERRAGGPPVLHVNVLYGLPSEETSSGSLVSLGRSSSTGSGSLSRASPMRHLSVPSTGSTSWRTSDGAVTSMGALPGCSVANSNGVAPSSGFAKPSLDLGQVRCISVDQWVSEAHVVNCMAPDCGSGFSLFNRKHHCRMCGRVFCSSCCNNLVYVPSASVSNTVNGSTEGVAVGSHTMATNASVSTSGAAPELLQHHRAGASNGSAPPNGMQRGPRSPAARGIDFSATGTFFFPGPTAAFSDGGGNLMSNTVTSSPVMAAAPSPLPPSTLTAVPCRVCASCFYEAHLVVSTRQENGEPRRRSRGELKMIQRVLLVNVMSFLTLRDLANVSLVSADFYFMSRDNVIWYQYNMTRWVKERELPRLSSLKSRAAAARAHQQRGPSWYTSPSSSTGTSARNCLAEDIVCSAPAAQDATTLSESETAKRVISLHARYNYTQFLDFARRQEMARCEGLSSFSLGARILLSSPLRVALVGPCGIGKTATARAFLGEKPSQMVVRPTIGFERRAVTVRLAQGFSKEIVLHIYDLSGAGRYEELRRFVCRQCHAIGLCYDPSRKVTLVQAADIMMELEGALGPQPVVVCGLVRQSHHALRAGSEPPSRHRAGPPRHATVAGAAAALSLSTPPRSAQQSGRSLPVGAGGKSMLDEPLCGAADGSDTPPPASISSASTAVASPGTAAEGGNDHGGHVLQTATSKSMTSSPLMKNVSNAPPPPPPLTTASSKGRPLEVSVEDAVGITVRGHSSIQCPLLDPNPFFEAVVQSVLDRLVEATVASTSSISEISAELTMQCGGSGSLNTSTYSASPPNAGSVVGSGARVSSARRPPRASRAIAQDLLNLTMQPCALDILLDR